MEKEKGDYITWWVHISIVSYWTATDTVIWLFICFINEYATTVLHPPQFRYLAVDDTPYTIRLPMHLSMDPHRYIPQPFPLPCPPARVTPLHHQQRLYICRGGVRGALHTTSRPFEATQNSYAKSLAAVSQYALCDVSHDSSPPRFNYPSGAVGSHSAPPREPSTSWGSTDG